jgi:cytochrome P450
VAALEADIRRRCEGLVSAMASQPTADLVSALAVPLPVATIAHLFGIEASDHGRFAAWSQAYVAQATGVSRLAVRATEPEIRRQTAEFRHFIGSLAAARRLRPGQDLISRLVASEWGAEVESEQVVDLCMLLLVGGNETTTNLLGNAVHALLAHPPLLEEAYSAPALAGPIVRETLRYDPPVQLVLRLATQEVSMAGRVIPQGGVVLALIGAANRDQARYAGAECFQLQRPRQPHLAFGSGIHFCLGAHLAELQATLALECLLGNTRIAPGTLPARRLQSFQLRGFRSLPLAVRRR